MMGKTSTEQYNSLNAPMVSTEKTSPSLRAHAGHGMVLAVICYLKIAFMEWLKFKKRHILFPSPCKEKQINKDFVKLTNKRGTKNFMQLCGSRRFF